MGYDVSPTVAAPANDVLNRLALRRSVLAELCRANGVRHLAIFGSAARDDFDPATSDLDVVVQFDAPTCAIYAARFFAIKEGLERMTGRAVDLVTETSITNPYLKRRIDTEKVTLFAA
jgi:predicted nucleotidyltransferase